MKKLTLWILMGLVVQMIGCGQENGPDPLIAQEMGGYELSLKKWNSLKEKIGGNYEYSVSGGSWTGYQYYTQVQFESGEVVRVRHNEHDFSATLPANVIKKFDTTSSWSEEGSELGSHTDGVLPLTLDEIYKRCSDEVLSQDPAENETIFETDEDGILKTCVYVPKNCADDCTIGYQIQRLDYEGHGGYACTTEAVAGIQVSIEDGTSATEDDFSVQVTRLDDGSNASEEIYSDDNTFSAAFERVGKFKVEAFANGTSFYTDELTVTGNDCHVVTSGLKLRYSNEVNN